MFKGCSFSHAIVRSAALALLALSLADSSQAQDASIEQPPPEPAAAEFAQPQNQFVPEASDPGRIPDSEDTAVTPEFYGYPYDIASDEAVIDMSAELDATRVSDPAEPEAAWFTVYAQNTADGIGARVLQAIDPPQAGLSLMPPLRRPTLLEVAGSDGAVVIERTEAFGSNAFRFILPPSHESALALHFDGVGPAPTLFAWTESALIAHNRQIALLVGAIGGLFAAALAFSGGAAIFGGRPFVQWSAVFLGALLFAFLTSSRVFDDT